MANADLICIHDEEIDESKPLTIFDPDYTWKEKTYENFRAVCLQKQIFKNGQLVYDMPTTEEIRNYCKEQVDTLWDEVKRFENPHNYYVDLSEKLWNCKQELLYKASKG